MSKYKPRVFKVYNPSGRQTVQPLNKREADNMRLLCKQRRDNSSASKVNNSKNPHWSERYKWDRNYMIIDLGLNTAFRIEDLIQLQVNSQVRKGYIDIVEFKTKRRKPFELNSRMKKELTDYIARNNLQDLDYLFTSRKGYNRPITRQQAYNMLQALAKDLGIVKKIGCHSLRKTFGTLYYKKDHNSVILNKMIHSGKGDPRVTLRYTGIEDEEVAVERKEFDI